MPGTSKAKGNR